MLCQDDGSSSSGKVSGGRVIVPTHTFMVKYYGALPVAVGTGIETVEEAAKVRGFSKVVAVLVSKTVWLLLVGLSSDHCISLIII